MRTFKIFAVLLTYPEQIWIEALDELEGLLREERRANGKADARLSGLFAYLRGTPLLALQENYVATFDQRTAHSLHLFEHIHGESRDRGSALVNLAEEYRRHGLEVRAAELPDYLPLFLEFLSLQPEGEGRRLLGEAVNVIALLKERLGREASPYAALFDALVQLSPARPAPAPQPKRQMEEAVIRFGPNPEGVEPLLRPNSSH
jgi:nitrate reductase delta subunit